jgi:hypothetical protein
LAATCVRLWWNGVTSEEGGVAEGGVADAVGGVAEGVAGDAEEEQGALHSGPRFVKFGVR